MEHAVPGRAPAVADATAATGLLWAKGADGVLTRCNAAFARWAGLAAQDLCGVAEAALFGPPAASLLAGQARQALRSGSSSPECLLLTAADGSSHVFEIVTTRFDEPEAPATLLCMARDITAEERWLERVNRRLHTADRVSLLQAQVATLPMSPVAVFRLLLDNAMAATESRSAFLCHVPRDEHGELSAGRGRWARADDRDAEEPACEIYYPAGAMRELVLQVANDRQPRFFSQAPAMVAGLPETVATGPCVFVPLPLDQPTLAMLVLYGRDGGYTQELLDDWQSLLSSVVSLAMMLAQLSQRLDAQQALRDSEERYRVLAENARELICLHQIDGRFLYVSPAAREQLGRGPEELIGHSPGEFIHADDIAVAMAPVGDDAGARLREMRWLRPDGSMLWVETRIVPRRDAAGQLIGFHSVTRDIDERKRDEQWLRLARATLHTSIDPFYWVDRNRRIVYANPAGCDLLGYSLEELQALPMRTLTPAGDEVRRQSFWTGSERVMEGRPVEAQLMARDGRVIDVEGSFMRIDTAEGVYICGCVRDITERKRAEDRLRLYGTVFEASHDSIALISKEHRYLDVNESYAQMVKLPRDLIRGLRTSDIHPVRIPIEVTTDDRWHGEVEEPQPDGSIVTRLLTVSGVRDHRGEIGHWVCTSSDISRLKQQQRKLQQLAHFDALTGLPNRVLLAERLQQKLTQARQSETLVALCYLDLDGFKRVNDQLGHLAGDELLIQVSQRLVKALPEGDTVARLGGDEFVLVLGGLADRRQGEAVLDRVLHDVALPVDLGEGRSAQVSASLGVTYFPMDDAEPELLLRHADQAMYLAKHSGPNRYHVFDADMERAARERQQVSAQFADALRSSQLSLYYEPIIDIRAGVVLGAEALLRWQHPTRGLLTPGAFLSEIDSTESLVELGEWAIRSAGRQLLQWERDGIDMMMSVNLAAQHLQQPAFADRLAVLLEGLGPHCRRRLRLEIVETAAFQDMALLSQTMQRCRLLGPEFALDDFGTGYSSLSYLRQLPADVVKIDRSFVSGVIDDPDDRALITGVVALARSFGRRVMAEGVETLAHGRALLDVGCDVGQGYGIARAMPPERFLPWVQAFDSGPWKTLAGSSPASRGHSALG